MLSRPTNSTPDKKVGQKVTKGTIARGKREGLLCGDKDNLRLEKFQYVSLKHNEFQPKCGGLPARIPKGTREFSIRLSELGTYSLRSEMIQYGFLKEEWTPGIHQFNVGCRSQTGDNEESFHAIVGTVDSHSIRLKRIQYVFPTAERIPGIHTSHK